MKNAMQFEPVLITQLCAAILALAIAFGVPITDDQRQAVLQVVTIVVTIFLGGAMVARSKAYAPNTVDRLTTDAYRKGYEAAVFKMEAKP